MCEPGRTGIQVSPCCLGTGSEETLSALPDLVCSSEVRAIGSSNVLPADALGALRHLTDEHKLHAVEQFIPLADQAGLSPTHLAMASATTHPGITGPRTIDHLEDLLAGTTTTLNDTVRDRINKIVPPGTTLGPLNVAYTPPAITRPALHRRTTDERATA